MPLGPDVMGFCGVRIWEVWCAGSRMGSSASVLLPQLPMTLRFPRDPLFTGALPECKSLEDNDSH